MFLANSASCLLFRLLLRGGKAASRRCPKCSTLITLLRLLTYPFYSYSSRVPMTKRVTLFGNLVPSTGRTGGWTLDLSDASPGCANSKSGTREAHASTKSRHGSPKLTAALRSLPQWQYLGSPMASPPPWMAYGHAWSLGSRPFVEAGDLLVLVKRQSRHCASVPGATGSALVLALVSQHSST